MTIIIGAEFHKRLTYKDTDGALADPDNIVTAVRKTGAASTIEAAPVQDSVGVYDLIWAPASVGVYWVEVTATGAGTFVDRVDEFTVCVTESSVA